MTTTSTSKKWSDDNIATLQSFVNGESPVSASVVQTAATAMNISERSVASKLRQLGQTVESMATVKAPKFSTEQGAALVAFLNNNVGTMTYKQIAEDFENGAFSAKEIQGKVLALELTNAV